MAGLLTPTVTPVSAHLHYDDVHGTWKIKARLLKRDADGAEYEVMVEESIDLGATISALLAFFSGQTFGPNTLTVMAQPSEVVMPVFSGGSYGAEGVPYTTQIEVGTLVEDFDDTAGP